MSQKSQKPGFEQGGAVATTHLGSMGSVSHHEQLYEAVKAIHYSAPWVILGYYIIAATVSVCTLQTITAKVKDHKAPRKLIFWVMVLIVATYVRVFHYQSEKRFPCEEAGEALTTSIDR